MGDRSSGQHMKGRAQLFSIAAVILPDQKDTCNDLLLGLLGFPVAGWLKENWN